MKKSTKCSFVSVLLVSLALVFGVSGPVQAEETAAEINAKVAATLEAFRRDIPAAEEYLKEAKGVLVVPDVKKVGFVIAAQWGTGALQEGGHTVDYYKMEAGSAGFQAGYQKADFVFIFLTEDAIKKFRDSKGWTVGAEAGLTLVTVGTGVSADTLKSQNAVAAFAFGKEGLMAGWSGKGTKFTRIEPGQ